MRDYRGVVHSVRKCSGHISEDVTTMDLERGPSSKTRMYDEEHRKSHTRRCYDD